jgi:WD40 repeat protein
MTAELGTPHLAAGGRRDRSAPFTRHRGPVTGAVALPRCAGEGLAVVSSGYDGALAISDVSERRMRLLGYHAHLVNQVALAPGGRVVASASSDHTVGLWSLDRGERVRTLRGHEDDVEGFAFADEATGVSVSRDRRAIVWDLASGSILRTLAGHEKDVLSVSCHGGRVFTSGDDMTLREWDLQSGRPLRCWGPFEHESDTLAIDARRGRAILGCDDGVLRVFELAAGRLLAAIPAHASGIKRVAASPVTGDVVSASYDGRVLVWDAETFACLRALDPAPAAWERSFCWTPDGAAIVAGTFDGTVVGWDARDGRRLFEVGTPGGNACLNEVAVVGDRVAAVADDGRVRLGRLTVHGGEWIEQREPRGGRVLANAVTADAAAGLVATGCHDQAVRVYGLAEGLPELHAVALGEGPVNSVRLLPVPGGHDLLAGCYSGVVVRLRSTGEVVSRFRVHEGAVKALHVVPERGLGVSCSADGTAFSWSLDTGERRMAFPAHRAIVNDLDVDPSARRIATVGRDFVLNVYSLDDGRLLQAFPLSRRSPKAVVFATPDLVVVGDYWGHLIRVPLRSGERRHVRIAENGISSLARRDDGRVVASSYDGAIFLVDPETLAVVTELREMTQRLVPVAG